MIFRLRVNVFRITAPFATQRAALEKHLGADASAIVRADLLDVQYNTLPLPHVFVMRACLILLCKLSRSGERKRVWSPLQTKPRHFDSLRSKKVSKRLGKVSLRHFEHRLIPSTEPLDRKTAGQDLGAVEREARGHDPPQSGLAQPTFIRHASSTLPFVARESRALARRINAKDYERETSQHSPEDGF